MQPYKLHKNFTVRSQLYQKPEIDESEYSPVVYERLEKLKLFEKMRAEGCSIETALTALKLSQSSFYRWRKDYKKFGLRGLEPGDKRPLNVRKPEWKQAAVQQILHLRKQNPLYGKAKIAVLLKRDHQIVLSVSTVGRIITDLIKRDKVKPAHFYCAKKRVRPRLFNKHAQRWKKGMKATKPGELFQIDHMTVHLTSFFGVKHFQGICPVTKMVVEQAYYCATSRIARQFLEYVKATLPFPLISIQVDGGSEFKKDFEQACKELDLPLFVLPPKTPENNGNVERANGSAKYEFYTFYAGPLSLFNLRKKLNLYVKKYNSYRPHQALQYQTPLQYYESLTEA
jgi:transposase